MKSTSITTPESSAALPKVALVYDRLNSSGGAEKVLIELQKLYPDAPLYTSVFDADRTPWLAPGSQVHTSWLQYVPGARRRHQWFGWLMPFLFELFDFSAFDIVISVSSEAAKGILTQPHQLHVNYLLTPTRYLWSHQEEYVQQVPFFFQPLMRAVIAWLQRWDRVAAQRPDVMIPISRVVQERAQQYYGRQTEPPLYPPVSLAAQATAPANESKLPQKFFFTWGRHVAYKQFDTVIRAVAAVRGSLIIAGEGPQTAALQSLAEQVFGAADNIFVGKITDEELRWYLEHAEATVFPQEEDFGIVMLESVLAGCPVIANEKSGATELLTSKDAVFLPDSSVESVVSALHEIGNNSWERLDIQRRARQYAGVRFSQEWKRQLEGHWEKHTQALQTGVKGNYE